MSTKTVHFWTQDTGLEVDVAPSLLELGPAESLLPGANRKCQGLPSCCARQHLEQLPGSYYTLSHGDTGFLCV